MDICQLITARVQVRFQGSPYGIWGQRGRGTACSARLQLFHINYSSTIAAYAATHFIIVAR